MVHPVVVLPLSVTPPELHSVNTLMKMMVNSQGVEHAKYFMKKGKTHPKHARFRANTMSTPWKIEVQRVTERGSISKVKDYTNHPLTVALP